jgi:hypothetical protein
MKYVFALVTLMIIALILAPVMMVRWSIDGWEDVGEGICRLYGIDN